MRAPADDAPLDAAQAVAAASGLKAMMPIHGRPFLDYALDRLARAGFRDVAIVIAPGQPQMEAWYDARRPSRLALSFVAQHEPRGTADAVLAAETWAGDEPFIILNSDNLYPVDVLARLREAPGPALPGFERDGLGLPLERTGAFALVEAGPDGYLARIVEKPGVDAVMAAGPRALISMNVWRADARLFEACRDVPVSTRGEKELPQAVGLAAARGVCFEVIPVRGQVLDLSSRADVAAVERALAGVEVNL